MSPDRRPSAERRPLPVRADLRGTHPYGAPQVPAAVRLNTNENPYPPSPALVAEIGSRVAQAATQINRYPDREALGLRADLASYLTRTTGVPVTAEAVWAANGSNEVLAQLFALFAGPGRLVLGFEPSYSMHRLLATGSGARYVAAARAEDFTLSVPAAVEAVRMYQPDVVVVCSPNNPTGTATPLAVLEVLGAELDRAGSGVLVVDEAYAEFSTTPSALGLLDGRDRMVVTRTMSKAFAFAGARLGYLAADPALVEALHLVRLPYHLSAITQAAAQAALAHAEELLITVEAVRMARDRMAEGLRVLGLTVAPSDANFLLVGGFADAPATWAALLGHGVLVRDVGLPGWLRVTAGTEQETTALLQAMDQVLSQPRTAQPRTRGAR